MKIKNASFVEKYIEKIVIAVALVFCLVVMWAFVLGGFTVKLKQKTQTKSVSVMEVERAIREKAKELDISMRRPSTQIDPEIRFTYAQGIRKRHTANLLEFSRYPLPFGRPGLDPADFRHVETANREYVLGRPPAPDELKTSTSHAVLLPEDEFMEVIRNRMTEEGMQDQTAGRAKAIAFEYAKHVDVVSPRDFSYVSVSAVFDIQKWAERLRKVPEANRIPEGWWRGRLFVTDVLLERQAQDPITRQWPADDSFEVIQTLPDALTFRPLHNPSIKWGSGQSQYLLEDIRAKQGQIARPSFAPVSDAKVWLPPSEAETVLSAQDQRKLSKVNREIKRLIKQLTNKSSQYEKLQEAEHRKQMQEQQQQEQRRRSTDRQTSRNRISDRAGGLNEMGSGFGRGVRSTRRNRRERDTEREDRRDSFQPTQSRLEKSQFELEQLQERLAKAMEEKDVLMGRGDESEGETDEEGNIVHRPRQTMLFGGGGFRGGGMGMMDPFMEAGGMFGGPGRRGFGGLGGRRGMRRMSAIGSHIEDLPGQITVWAHDLTVEPGMTCRYRMRVRVVNPLFQRSSLSETQKQEYFNLLAVDSEPTDWCEPVEVERSVYFFVVSVDRANHGATVEVYRIHDGRRHEGKFKVTAGDPIGGKITVTTGEEERELDMWVDAVAVDARDRAGSVGSSSVLIYYDHQSQRLVERLVESDVNNDTRFRLKNEVTEAEELDDRTASMEGVAL